MVKATAAVKAKPLALDAHMTVVQALQAIVANALAQIRGNRRGVTHGSDPECVHQMRIGIRRLRSALRLFATVAALAPAQRAELDWLNGELGAARDWEVLAASTLAAVAAANPAEDGLAGLRQAVLERAAQQRQTAAAAVGSARCARLLRSLAALARRTCTGDMSDRPLAGHAATLLRRRQAKLLKRGAALVRATPQERHLVRIAAKQLRYGSEFFQALYPPRRVARTIERLAALQDALGVLNDAAVAETLLQTLAQEHPALDASAGFARGWLAGQRDTHLRRLRTRWRAFAAAAPPWAR